MIDIQKTIDEVEALTSLGADPQCMKDAIKVMKMWRDVKKDSCEFELIRWIEEDYFPTKMRQTVTIEIERKSESLLEDTIDQVRLVPGVKDVRPHDSRY